MKLDLKKKKCECPIKGCKRGATKSQLEKLCTVEIGGETYQIIVGRCCKHILLDGAVSEGEIFFFFRF